MGTSVIDLIHAGAQRRQPTTKDIQSLASGASDSGTRVKTKTKKKTSSASTRSVTKTSVARSKAPKAKAPCKYGPRDADGRCPKKPSNPRRQTASNRTKVTARTPSSATSQAIDVVTNPRANSEQKAAAVAKVAETTATSGVKAAAKKVAKSGKVQKAKQTAIDLAKKVPVGGVLGPFVSAAGQVLKAMPTEAQLKKAKSSRQKAEAAVKNVERELGKKGQKLTKKQRNVLLKQHIDFYQKG